MVKKQKSDLFFRSFPERSRLLLLLIFLIIICAAFFASSFPDGLDHVSRVLGFAQVAVARPAPMSGYRIPGVCSSGSSAVLAGALGALICALIFILPGLLVRCRGQKK